MNGVKMGSCKLKVNVAKFAVENVGLKELEERAGRKQDKHDTRKDWKQDKREADWQNKGFGQSFQPGAGLSFRAVLSGKSSKVPSVVVESGCKSINVPDNVVAFYEIRGRALIGRARNLKTLTCLKQLCEENRVGGFNIVYVGGLSLLLNFKDKADAVEMMLNKELSLDDGDISVGLVGILVGDGKIINDSVDLKWTNKVFKTWITEEKGNWEPECIGMVEKKAVDVNVTAAVNDGVSPEKCYVSKSVVERVVNEESEVVIEEGVLKDKVASVSGDDENIKVNDTFLFNSSKSGPKPKKRPVKLIKKGGKRVQHTNFSPSDIVRPKKRSRNEVNDPFDLDRFIGILHNEEGIEGDPSISSPDSLGQGVDVDSLDLNRDVTAPEIIDEGSGMAVEQVDEEGGFLVQEVAATVDVGAVLGVDLTGHEGGLDKAPWLNKLKRVNGVDFLAIQETKADSLSNFVGISIWGNKNYGMEFVGSVGQSGGNVGNGNDTSFWIDPWLLNIPLMVFCPNLFRAESDKRCKVSERLLQSEVGISRVWNWKRSVSEAEDRAELVVLNSLLNAVALSEEMDSWGWIWIGNGAFSVSAVRELMYEDMDFSNISVFEWCKWIPKKCNIFGWRAEMGRIPTACELRHRNIPIVDVTWMLCGDAEGSVDHLFTGCITVARVWQHISSWCKVHNFFAFSFKDLLEVHNFVGFREEPKTFFMVSLSLGVGVFGGRGINKSSKERRLSRLIL
ncbi:RNA-directed DNA polymerase, eukaryota, Reverse transcriptase zinc-binding domain protein [Artemisia annua]|uniref:RNA-directed DNA polymerase, eukaryota, Reverse transcriptase zinc-binding domain protein n=1 Tax=Artemisia annua TaxID=35608 RepID=A0A2U1Q4G8_ARTAN|nr:RNA-directed DNA polymerase, eukaryota, Reverse transcriptase zinc-binding domain protein [Artemisia annua]